MQKLLVATIAVCFSLSSLSAQTSNAVVSGTIADESGAHLPAVSVTATNTRTGIVTNVMTNAEGIYNFASLQPGVYSFSAALPGFITQSIQNVVLGSTQERINFKLSTVSEAQATLATGASSVSDVLSEDLINRLPLVGNNALSLLDSLPGIVADDDVFGGLVRNFGGVGQVTVHTTRDGVVVSHGSYNLGAYATTVLHPDWVGEIRLVLSPADAESGTGNAQVRIQTRSGTNQYSGSATWNIRNSALNANTWTTNATSVTPDWYNNHEYTIAYGGPIVKDKTFFYALWDQQFNYQRSLTPGSPATLAAPAANALTAPARNGIFRYFERWVPGNALALTNTQGQNPTTASVDMAGNPIAPLTNPDGSTYTGGLRCFSVFGNVKFDGTPFTSADCPGGTALTSSAPWDSRRPVSDPTGYIRKIIDKMPLPNSFGFGDGLNRAAYRWMQRREGSQGVEVFVGRDLLTDREQLNLKIDENLNRQHKLNAGWTLERNDTLSELPTWPGGLGYPTTRRPQVLTVGLTSSLSPMLLNEGRFGIRLQDASIITPWESEEFKTQAAEYMLPGSNGHLALISPGMGPYAFGGSANGVMTTNPAVYVGGKATMYSYADTVSWSLGKHAFRTGAELRFQNGLRFSNLFGTTFGLPHPRITGGPGGNNSPLGNAIQQLPNLPPMARTQAANMIYFLAGSVNNASMTYWIDEPTDLTDGTWENTQTKRRRDVELNRREWTAFLKDDWKVTPNLTLNLGVRYEYYGSPYLSSGMTTTARDQGDGLFGTFRTGGGDPFSRWLQPGSVFLNGYGPNASASTALTCVAPDCDINKLTVLELVGPNSPNPSKGFLPADRNNFGPAIGFAWRLPWLGEDKTTVRGGYQITFGGSLGAILNSSGGPVVTTQNQADSLPGNSSIANLNIGALNGQYLDLTSIPSLIPVAPTNPATPGRQLTVFASTSPLDYYAFDSHYVTPYIQNFNLSVSRALTRNIALDVRYISTIGRKQTGVIDLNTPNVYHNPELFDALELTRAGGNAPLFDQMFAGLNLNNGVSGYAAVGTVFNGALQTGSSHLRRNATFAPLLANGNYPELAKQLNANGGSTAGGFLNLPQGVTGVSGRLLRNGCDRLAAGQTTIGPGNSGALRCFPEDYLRANPQLAGAYLNTNSGSSNYHSVQTQISIRQNPGLIYTGTYTWSKSLGIPSIAAFTYGSIPLDYYTDPSDRNADYTYTSMHRKHDFRGSATADLPFGPGRFLFRNSSGWLARLAENWQTSVIFGFTSGGRSNIEAGFSDNGFATGLYGNSVPDVVRKWPSFVTGDVQFTPESGGSYFTDGMSYYPDLDPQCASVTTQDNLRSQCALQAIVEAFSGEFVLQNPKPGTRGTFGQRKVELAGNWNLDANLSKAFEMSESSFIKKIQLRVDATNILNHPRPLAPDLFLNSPTFGIIFGKGDQIRSFQGQLRVEF